MTNQEPRGSVVEHDETELDTTRSSAESAVSATTQPVEEATSADAASSSDQQPEQDPEPAQELTHVREKQVGAESEEAPNEQSNEESPAEPAGAEADRDSEGSATPASVGDDEATGASAAPESDAPAVEAQPDETVSSEATSETPALSMAAAVDGEAASSADDAPVAAAQPDETVPSEAASETPPTEAGAEDEGAEAASGEGASFTPVEESDSPRPRRIKDLEEGMELEGRITSIALYGVFVDISVKRDGLVHISEMSDTHIETPSDVVQIGDTVTVRVKGVDLDKGRISLTMRSPRGESESRGGRRSRRPDVNRDELLALKAGDMVEGTITGLAPFGAFVDIGVGKDGLVHISELAEGRVDRPEDAVQVGETHTFRLLDVDPEGTRISLSLRRALRVQRMRELESGQVLEGRISGLAPFGAFVDIGVGRDGLVHISQLAEHRVEKVEDVVKVGDAVTVRILEVDPQSKRISLTMRPESASDYEESDEGASSSSEPAGFGAQFDLTPQQREEQRRRSEGRRRDRNRSERRAGRGEGGDGAARANTAEVYVVGDDDTDDDFEGNATLEDLVNKFGGTISQKNRRRRDDDDDEGDEDDDDMQRQQRQDMIERTLSGSQDES